MLPLILCRRPNWLDLPWRRRGHFKFGSHSLCAKECGKGKTGHWELEQIADKCGCNVNTVSTALTELMVLGWIKKGQERHRGQYGSFVFELQKPPATLTASACATYGIKAANASSRG